MRSFLPKYENFAQDSHERGSDCIFLTEIWQKSENKKHQFKIEDLLETKGIKYISTPRPGARRGGGAAIAVRLESFTISKLNICIPKPLEVVWGLLRPKMSSGKISSIIVCCFYSPPKSKKKKNLVDHITVTLQSLLISLNNPGIIISGDRNDLEISALLSADPSLRQIVQQPTRGSKILDVIITNLASFYNPPKIIPPVLPDKPGHGVPSDHNGVIATPISNESESSARLKIKKFIRPLPESLIPAFEAKFKAHNFQALLSLSSSEMVEQFQTIVNNTLSDIFPEKKISITPYDVPWFTEELRHLKRQRQREYVCHGKTEKYHELKLNFEEKLKTQKAKYRAKIEVEVKEGCRGSSYPALKRMGARVFDMDKQMCFQLPEHAQLNLTSAQSAEVIAEYFSRISREFEPLSLSALPPNVQRYLSDCNQTLAPILSPSQVLVRITRAKKPNSQVPGDLPKKLVKYCANILAIPASIIFNKISTTAEFPSQWKVENQIAIPKSYPPENEDDLRNIAKTPFLSKVYESIVGSWLLPIIQPFLDPGQCGIKGFSISHYLIKLLHFVHSTLDLKKPHAVLVALVDISKAFNRIDHSLVIQDLYDMHTPAWLLKIVASYLSGRSMFLSYNGCRSSVKMLPGGGPQGAFLGGLIFIIKYNGAFLRPPIPRPIRGPVRKSRAEKVKYVDDGSVATSIDLKQCLIPDPVDRIRPVSYNERTGHILPPENNLLQFYLEDTELFTHENKMVINTNKTKVMKFSRSRKWDFPPELKFSNGSQVDSISETKLVGVIISQNLRWQKNTEYICNKARKKLWILRRLVKLDLDLFALFDVYTKEVRSILELAVPVWHSGLTKLQSSEIERIQKIAFRIILGSDYSSYEQACKYFGSDTLENRRTKLCLKFAKKNFKSDKCMFTKTSDFVQTRSKNIVKEYKCRTDRFKKSSLPYLSKLLNTENKKKG